MTDRQKEFLKWIREDHGKTIYIYAKELLEEGNKDYQKYDTLLQDAIEKFCQYPEIADNYGQRNN